MPRTFRENARKLSPKAVVSMLAEGQ